MPVSVPAEIQRPALPRSVLPFFLSIIAALACHHISQCPVMATDAEWERIGRAAAESGMDLSRFVIHRALDMAPLPPEVLRRAVREMLERIAVMFAAWVSAMAASGRSEELRAARPSRRSAMVRRGGTRLEA